MSTLTITSEQHFVRTPRGVYVRGNENYDFFSRYLGPVERVTVLARAREQEQHEPDLQPVEGRGVELAPLPEFRGLGEFTRRVLPVVRASIGASRPAGAFLLRVPGLVATLVWLGLRARGRPYGVEVVADPDEGFQRRAFDSPLAPAVRPVSNTLLRRQCRRALAASYVTRETLQQRYPAPGAPTFHYSSADIGDEAFAWAPAVLERLRQQDEELRGARLGFVGRLYRPSKGLDTLLRAVARLDGSWPGIRLRVMGGGPLLPGLQELADELGIGDRVEWLGEINNRERLYARLAECDVFVLPSRQEGLPRSVIEAMAVGLPVLATPVGGTAEIVDAAELFAVDDDVVLARRLDELLRDRARRVRLSRRNAAIGRDYRREELNQRRREFLQVLLERTAERT